MAVETHQIRDDVWKVWLTADYTGGPNGQPKTLISLRCHNTSEVTVRLKVNTGRGANTTERAVLVGPGEDRTMPTGAEESAGWPINLQGNDAGIAVEQV